MFVGRRSRSRAVSNPRQRVIVQPTPPAKTKLLVITPTLEDSSIFLGGLREDVDYIQKKDTQTVTRMEVKYDENGMMMVDAEGNPVEEEVQTEQPIPLTKDEVLAKVTSSTTHIGFVYHGNQIYTMPYLNGNLGETTARKGFFSNEFIALLEGLKEKNPMIKVDLLACDLNSDGFKKVVAELEEEIGIDIRYSLDKTGFEEGNGNWVMESDGVDVKDVYFTENIGMWKHILNAGTLSDLNGMTLVQSISNVMAITSDASYIYVGGSFRYFNGLTAPVRIVKYNKSTGLWNDLPSGINVITINALHIIDTYLYVAGTFFNTGDIKGNIAKYDTINNTWNALGSGVNSEVRSLSSIGTDLYVGGNFTTAGGVSASRIAKYDTTIDNSDNAWSALGDGVNNTVWTLSSIGTDLYVGGSFTTAGGVSASRIAKYDTTKTDNTGWSLLGTGMNNTVTAVEVIGTDLYVGGSFTTAGGVSASRIAKYDTNIDNSDNAWSTLGSGVNSTVQTLSSIGTDLYVGGGFFTAGGISVTRMAKYDTTNNTWSALGSGVGSMVYAIHITENDIYIGNQELNVYTNNVYNNIAFVYANAGRVYRLLNINNKIYMGGNFDAVIINNIHYQASKILSYDLNTNEIGILGSGLNNDVRTLSSIGTDLYVGGDFNAAGGKSANRIAKYDTTIDNSNNAWSALGSGVGSTVNDLTTIGTDLYVGGTFTTAGGVSASRIAKYDTTVENDNSGWSALGGGVSNSIRTLLSIGTDLYVGGSFSQAGGNPASRIAKYDTTKTDDTGWSALGSGVNGTVLSLAYNGTDLYVGGSFSQAGGNPASRIAKYDITNNTWSALGSGVNNSVWSLSSIGSDLYIGGSFSQAGGFSGRNRIAKYDTTVVNNNSGWSALGNGFNGDVYSMVKDAEHIYIGGLFTDIIDSSSAVGIAKYTLGVNDSKPYEAPITVGETTVSDYLSSVTNFITPNTRTEIKNFLRENRSNFASAKQTLSGSLISNLVTTTVSGFDVTQKSFTTVVVDSSNLTASFTPQEIAEVNNASKLLYITSLSGETITFDLSGTNYSFTTYDDKVTYDGQDYFLGDTIDFSGVLTFKIYGFGSVIGGGVEPPTGGLNSFIIPVMISHTADGIIYGETTPDLSYNYAFDDISGVLSLQEMKNTFKYKDTDVDASGPTLKYDDASGISVQQWHSKLITPVLSTSNIYRNSIVPPSNAILAEHVVQWISSTLFGHPQAQAPITNDQQIHTDVSNSTLGQQLYNRLAVDGSANDVSGSVSNDILLSMWEQLVEAGRFTDGSGDDPSLNAYADTEQFISFPYKPLDKISFLVRIEGYASTQTGVFDAVNADLNNTTNGTESSLSTIFQNVDGVTANGSDIVIDKQVWKFTYVLN